MNNAIKGNPFIITSLVILVAGFGYYIFLYQQDNLVVPNNVKRCKDIDSEELILQAQAIEDRKTEYKKVFKEVFKEPSKYSGEQINYMIDGRTLMIEQLLPGDDAKSYISYYLQNGKVFYFRRDYREYDSPEKVNDPESKPTRVEIADFFLDSDQKLCVWYSDQIKQASNANIEQMVNYFISGL